MPKFDDNENKQINKTIRSIKSDMTIKLKESEGYIKEIISTQAQSSEDQSIITILMCQL